MAWLAASQGLKNLVLEVFITVTILSISWLLRKLTRSLHSPRTTQGHITKPRKSLSTWHEIAGKTSPKSTLPSEKVDIGTDVKKQSSWPDISEEEEVLEQVARPEQGATIVTSSLEPNVLITAVRKGRVTELPHLLDVACERSARRLGADTKAYEEQVRGHLLRVLRTCASAQRYAAALHAYEHMKDRIGPGCRSTWSLLLYISVESGAYYRGREFYQLLCEDGPPLGQDVVNIVRCLANAHDVTTLRSVLSDASLAGVNLDSTVRNRSLAACCTEGALDMAEIIASCDYFASPMDVVGYNSLIKSFARKGKVHHCLELQRNMRANGVEPSEMTFGILLDACINAKDFNLAMSICKEFNTSGHCLNKVHLTTIIKGLASSRQLVKAEAMLREMKNSMHMQPDIITYQTLLKGYMDNGDINSALRLLDLMQEQNLKPDVLMCDSMFVGCCARGLSAASTMHVLNVLSRVNIKPSPSSLTLVIRTFAQNEAWQEALDLLQELPSRFNGLRPEIHLYAQLGLACIKGGNMDMAQEVYKAMWVAARQGDEDVEKFASCRLLQHCVACEESEARAIAFGPPSDAPLRSTMVVGSQDSITCSPALAQRMSCGTQASRLSQFISINQLDVSCAQMLCSLPPPQAEWVMDQGFVIGTTREGAAAAESDQSAAASANLMKRVSRLGPESSKHWEMYPEAADLRRRLDDFVLINKLDRRCEDTLRGLSRAQLLWVMDQEFLVQVDPAKGTAAAKVISLVRRAWAVAKRQTELRVLGPTTSPGGGAAVAHALDDFISINQLDDRCARLLKTLPYADVAWVMDQEFLITVDPSKGTASAKVVGLITKVKLGGFASR